MLKTHSLTGYMAMTHWLNVGWMCVYLTGQISAKGFRISLNLGPLPANARRWPNVKPTRSILTWPAYRTHKYKPAFSQTMYTYFDSVVTHMHVIGQVIVTCACMCHVMYPITLELRSVGYAYRLGLGKFNVMRRWPNIETTQYADYSERFTENNKYTTLLWNNIRANNKNCFIALCFMLWCISLHALWLLCGSNFFFFFFLFFYFFNFFFFFFFALLSYA